MGRVGSDSCSRRTARSNALTTRCSSTCAGRAGCPLRYEIEPSARRFEDWEFPYALVLGQAEAVRYALRVGIQAAQQRAWSLAERLRAALARPPTVRVLDQGRVRCALVTAAFDGLDARELVTFLAARHINVVASLREFGQLDFGSKRVDTALRLSPHYFNTEDEIDAAAQAVGEFLATRAGARGASGG